ncbi:MAG: hypothetical protein ABII12_03160 [Planctomycetota bacterium]
MSEGMKGVHLSAGNQVVHGPRVPVKNIGWRRKLCGVLGLKEPTDTELHQAAVVEIGELRDEVGALRRHHGMPPSVVTQPPSTGDDDTPLSEIGVSDEVVELLVANDPLLATVGELVVWMETRDLTEIPGIGLGRAKAVKEALEAHAAEGGK